MGLLEGNLNLNSQMWFHILLLCWPVSFQNNSFLTLITVYVELDGAIKLKLIQRTLFLKEYCHEHKHV